MIFRNHIAVGLPCPPVRGGGSGGIRGSGTEALGRNPLAGFRAGNQPRTDGGSCPRTAEELP